MADVNHRRSDIKRITVLKILCLVNGGGLERFSEGEPPAHCVEAKLQNYSLHTSTAQRRLSST